MTDEEDDDFEVLPKPRHRAQERWEIQNRVPLQADTPCDIVWDDLARQALLREWLQRGEPKRMILPVELDGTRYATFALVEMEHAGKRVLAIVGGTSKKVYAGREL